MKQKRQTPEKNKTLRFYVASLAPLLLLAVIGYFVADEWGLISKRESFYSTHKGMRDAAYVDLPQMTISLGGSMALDMQVDISLEVAGKDASVIEGYLPQIMDRFNTYLPRARLDGLNKPGGELMLRKEMLWQVNHIGIPVRIHDVILQNLVFM